MKELGELVGGTGGGEGDDGTTEADLVSQLRGGTEGIGGRNDDAEGHEGEVDNGDMMGGRREDEGDVALGEGVSGGKGEGEGVDLTEEVGVGEGETGVGVDGEGGGRG